MDEADEVRARMMRLTWERHGGNANVGFVPVVYDFKTTPHADQPYLNWVPSPAWRQPLDRLPVNRNGMPLAETSVAIKGYIPAWWLDMYITLEEGFDKEIAAGDGRVEWSTSNRFETERVETLNDIVEAFLKRKPVYRGLRRPKRPDANDNDNSIADRFTDVSYIKMVPITDATKLFDSKEAVPPRTLRRLRDQWELFTKSRYSTPTWRVHLAGLADWARAEWIANLREAMKVKGFKDGKYVYGMSPEIRAVLAGETPNTAEGQLALTQALRDSGAATFADFT